MKEYETYKSYEYDYLTEGGEIKVEHSIYVNETDISDLISKPIEKIQAMRDGSVTKEKAAFEKVLQAVERWEKQAALTQRFNWVIEYLKCPESNTVQING